MVLEFVYDSKDDDGQVIVVDIVYRTNKASGDPAGHGDRTV